jgi:hypothetical protein
MEKRPPTAAASTGETRQLKKSDLAAGAEPASTNGWIWTKKEPLDLSHQYQRLIKHLSAI